MMQRLFGYSTLAFWLAVAGFWAVSAWFPQTPATQIPPAQARVNEAAVSQPQITGSGHDTRYTLAEVARHATGEDCWMVINDQIYDFSAYLPQHPANPSVFLPWCGKEASDAYRTKTRGRRHSAYADQLLPKYRIGTLESGH